MRAPPHRSIIGGQRRAYRVKSALLCGSSVYLMLQTIMHAVSHATISFSNETIYAVIRSLSKGRPEPRRLTFAALRTVVRHAHHDIPKLRQRTDRGLGRRQPCNRYAIGRARNVVQS